MPSKPKRILVNAALVFAAWIGAGVACWGLLAYFDPAGWVHGDGLNALGANIRTMAATVAQIAATMAGFVLAALALILSLSEKGLIQRMSVSGHLHVLVLRMKLSIVVCLLLTAGGIGFIVIPYLGAGHLYVAAAACLTAALSFVDVLWKLLLVFLFFSPLPSTEPQAVRTLYGDVPDASDGVG